MPALLGRLAASAGDAVKNNEIGVSVMNAATTLYPATVRQLGDMAHERGMTAVELLEELGPFPWPTAA